MENKYKMKKIQTDSYVHKVYNKEYICYKTTRYNKKKLQTQWEKQTCCCIWFISPEKQFLTISKHKLHMLLIDDI